MGSDDRFVMRFWGVRGSVPTPGADTIRYGGNTSCVEVRCGDRLFILDGGTGLINLGRALQSSAPVNASLFFTHLHWDHIQGVPFFAPLYQPDTQLTIYSQRKATGTAEDILRAQMKDPTFPIELSTAPGNLRFETVDGTETLDMGDGVQIDFAPLNHPGGSLGIRIQYRGRSVTHITDNEHLAEGFSDEVIRLCTGAHFINFDAAYTDDEYHGRTGPSRKGWGHSTWQEGMRLAQEVQPEAIVLFHHDFTHSDDMLDGIHEQARQIFPNTWMAIEGMEIDIMAGTYKLP